MKKIRLPTISPEAVARILRGAVIVVGAAAVLVLPQFTTNASFDGVVGLPGPVAVLGLGLALWLMPMLLAASWVAEGRARLLHPWLALPVALFVVGAAISAALAADKSSALVRAAEMTGVWAGAWALAEPLRSNGERRFLLAVLVAAAVGAAAVGIHQQAWGLPDAWQYFQEHREEVLARQNIVPGSYAEKAFIGRFTGGVQAGLGHPNVLAALLALGLLVAAGLVREKWSEVRTKGSRGLAVVLTLAALVCAAGLALTQSRGGIIAALVGLWWLGVAWWTRRRSRRLALYLLPLAAGAAALAVAATADGPTFESGLLSLRYRLDYWQATAQVLLRHGLAGVGLENFGLHYTEFKLPTAPEEIRDPHNLVLSMWSNLGLAGLAALVGLAVIAIRSWLRTPDIEPSPGPDAGAPGGGAANESLLAFLVPTIVIAFVGLLALGFFERPLAGWLAAVVIGGSAMVLMGLGSAEEPSRLSVSCRPLRSLSAACVAAVAAFALMEQIGTSILEPPTAWAMLVVICVSLRPPAARSWVLSLGEDELELAAAPEPGVRLGLWAKFALMLLVMAAGFSYARVLLVPFMREDALLAEAARQGDAAAQEPILEAAAAANPFSWEPAIFRARAWQQQAASEQAQERSLSLERAMTAYDEALARQPRLRQACLGLAVCRLTMPGSQLDRGAWQAALGYVEEALRLYPTDIPTQELKAKLLDRLGEDAPALAAYRRLLDLDREMPDEIRRLPPDFRAAVEDRIRQLEAAAKPDAAAEATPQ